MHVWIPIPVPFTNPRTIMISDYPKAWCDRYNSAGYVNIDPTVLHAQMSQVPIVWSDSLFENTHDLWEEANAHGLVVGWAQSTLDRAGGSGMLMLARSAEPLSATELEAKELSMRRLADLAHAALSYVFRARLGGPVAWISAPNHESTHKPCGDSPVNTRRPQELGYQQNARQMRLSEIC